jgi:phosphoribosyl 1,2-cyclic phosphate phosphodiesterase
MLGYEYPAAYLDHPKNHRTRASLLLQGPTGNLLVDCTPEMRLQLTREKVLTVESVLITHTHADHVMGMDDLRSLCILGGRAMPVYTLPRYQEDIRRIFDYAFREFPQGLFVPRFDLFDVPEVLEVGGMRVRTFLVEHGQIPVIGLRVGGFAYVTDVSRIPPEAEEHLQDLDVLVLDAVRKRPHPNHLHYDAALEEIARLRPRKAYLTHLGHDYDHDVTNAELPDGVELAFDGLRIDVSV